MSKNAGGLDTAANVNALYKEVALTRRMVEEMYRRIVRVLPAREGTEEWWAREDELGMEDYRQGKYVQYDSVDEFVKAMEKKLDL